MRGKEIILKSLVNPEINVLCNEFLEGDNIPLELSENIFKTAFINKDVSYIDSVTKAKCFLTNSKKTIYYDLYIVESSLELTKEEEVAVIRYINITNTKELIILINERVIYVPNSYMAYGENVIFEYTNEAYKRYLKYIDTKRKIIEIKSKITLLKNYFNIYILRKVQTKVCS